VLDSYTNAEELETLAWSKSSLLAPFPNRLRDGAYQLEGVTYQFPINSPNQNNAIHGFAKLQHLVVKAILLTKNEAAITCLYESDGSEQGYPFAHSLEATFTISDAKGIKIELCFKNRSDQTIPVGLGWHPYFKLSDHIEDSSLEMVASERLFVDERMLPTLERTNFEQFTTLSKIGNTSLDDCFALSEKTQQDGLFEITMQCDEKKLTYWQETGNKKYNFVQLFTPPSRDCLAIEPMTCAPDAFNNGLGLVNLAPDEELSGAFGFSITKLQLGA
jgi:aldose 1-epimerase